MTKGEIEALIAEARTKADYLLNHCHTIGAHQDGNLFRRLADALALTRAPEDRIGRHEDIIREALNEYDGWMKDDDYDARGCLDRIVAKMRDRLDLGLALTRGGSEEAIARIIDDTFADRLAVCERYRPELVSICRPTPEALDKARAILALGGGT